MNMLSKNTTVTAYPQAAIVTSRQNWRGKTLYGIKLSDGGERTFERAQDAADWIENRMPGAVVEWRVCTQREPMK